MFARFYIRQHERGLLFRNGDLIDVLAPGVHYTWRWNDRVEIVDTLQTRFDHKLLDVLIRNEKLASQLVVVDLTDTQRALVWKDGRLLQIVGPGRHAYWREPSKIEVETFSIETVRFTHAKLQTVMSHPDAPRWLTGVRVEQDEDVLLYRDGQFVETLTQGLHAFWSHAGRFTSKIYDRREQTADVAGQEIITQDKVTLRVNLVVTWLIADVLKVARTCTDAAQALYREAQLVLRAAVGARSLDALLADKEAVGNEVRQALSARAAELGLLVKSVGLRDIILPGDMKTLLNQVIAATKEAEANLIRRREETAAARSQANTARLLAESPHLMRLKELELLKDVLSNTNATFVLGQGELTDQLRTLVATKS